MRCFLALTPSDEVLDALCDLQEGLPGANWAPEENLHLTLVFLGDQPRRALEDLDAALLQIKETPFELTLSGVGAFGGRDARLVYAGVSESPALRRLQAKTETAARHAEIEVEGRRYTPHVTLARWGRGRVSEAELARYMALHSLFSAGPFEIDRFALFRSELSRGGPHYERIADYELQRAP